MSGLYVALDYLYQKREQLRLDFNKRSLRDILGEPLTSYNYPVFNELNRMIEYLEVERTKAICLTSHIRLPASSAVSPTALGVGWSG